MQTPFVRVKPGIFPTWRLSFFKHHLPSRPTPRRGQESPFLEPQRPHVSSTAFRGPHFRLSPLPQVSPFPGVSRYSDAPLPVVPPSQGSLSLAPGAHRLAGTHRPGYGAERGSIGGGSLVRQRAQNRPALPTRPARPLAPEVTYAERGRRGTARECACATSRIACFRSPPGGQDGAVGPEPGKRVAGRPREHDQVELV